MEIKELSDQHVRIRKVVIEICPGQACDLRYSFDVQLLGAHIGKVEVRPFEPFFLVVLFFFQSDWN